jgi:hypothetical protein
MEKENEFERKFNTKYQLHSVEMKNVKENHLKYMDALNALYRWHISISKQSEENISEYEEIIQELEA